MNLYQIEHDETCGVYEGTARELSKIIGVTPGTIQKKAVEYGKVAQHWRVKKIAEKIARKDEARKQIVKVTKAKEMEMQLLASQDKCMNCGKMLPVKGKSGYFCCAKCGRDYRQRAYNALLREDTKARKCNPVEKKKPKLSLAEIDAMAKAAGMHYGDYVAINGL